MSATGTVSITLIRTLDASPAEVFEAWTDPAVLRRWFAPGSVEVAEARAEPRVGGVFRVRMRTPDGEHPTVDCRYREVRPSERLVFTWRWEGSDTETLVTVALRALGDGRTELTLTHEGFADADTRDHHEEGWGGCLAKLQRLAGDGFPPQLDHRRN